MVDRNYNVLFVCTGNSARSIMAEAALKHWGKGKFNAYSAGSFPRGEVHPMTLALLRDMRLPTEGLRSKSWDEYAEPSAPKMDFMFTVCDKAAGEACPIWPGKPITAHWGFPDPAAAEGTAEQRRKVFSTVYRAIDNRVKLFCALPFETLDRMALEAKLRQLGRDEKVKV